MRSALSVIACLVGLTGPALAHEFWLEPLAYVIPSDGNLQAELVNGQNFAGIELSYLPQRFVHFEMTNGTSSIQVENRLGARPAVDTAPLGEGLHILTYVSTPSRVSYDDFAKFARFAEHKDFPDIEVRHRALGFPMEEFGEAYTRFAKSLVQVGNDSGEDRRIGLETEFVMLDSPYHSDPANGLRVQLFYQDATRNDAQVELFDKAPDGTVTITLHRTDQNGIATLPVTAGHSYLADAVVLREPSPELAAQKNSVWETLWADLTFMVPET